MSTGKLKKQISDDELDKYTQDVLSLINSKSSAELSDVVPAIVMELIAYKDLLRSITEGGIDPEMIKKEAVTPTDISISSNEYAFSLGHSLGDEYGRSGEIMPLSITVIHKVANPEYYETIQISSTSFMNQALDFSIIKKEEGGKFVSLMNYDTREIEERKCMNISSAIVAGWLTSISRENKDSSTKINIEELETSLESIIGNHEDTPRTNRGGNTIH